MGQSTQQDNCKVFHDTLLWDNLMEYRLLEKTELWISPVKLTEANLNACAVAVGKVLGLGGADIMVTDALSDRLTLDILVPSVSAEHIVSKERAVLEALAAIPGVETFPDTSVHSEGVLGLISLEEGERDALLQRSQAMRDEIMERIARRAIVIATGAEVVAGQIEDTNTPFLLERLSGSGFEADRGPVLADNSAVIARALREAADHAYGLAVTTGGIGAEGKDQTLEALCAVDPDSVNPYVLKFRKGHGRHEKDGVRLGVGCLGQLLMVCLPGPHDEVEMLWPILRQGLHEKWDKKPLAEALAARLRKKFLSSGGHHPRVHEHAILGSES